MESSPAARPPRGTSPSQELSSCELCEPHFVKHFQRVFGSLQLKAPHLMAAETGCFTYVSSSILQLPVRQTRQAHFRDEAMESER